MKMKTIKKKKIKKTKRENEIDDELKSYNITAKKFCYYNIKNKDANKSNLTKENKFKEMNIKNNCVNINLDEGINKDSLDMLFDTKKNTLAKSLGKKEMNNLKSESDKKLRTDEDLENDNIKIKKELTKIGKEKIRPFSGIDKLKLNKYI